MRSHSLTCRLLSFRVSRPAGDPMSQTVTPILEHRRGRLQQATTAATEMLTALGVPGHEDDLAGTPRRLVHAYAELLTPGAFEMTTFPIREDSDQLVLVRDIPVRSLCDPHLLPFIGV